MRRSICRGLICLHFAAKWRALRHAAIAFFSTFSTAGFRSSDVTAATAKVLASGGFVELDAAKLRAFGETAAITLFSTFSATCVGAFFNATRTAQRAAGCFGRSFWGDLCAGRFRRVRCAAPACKCEERDRCEGKELGHHNLLIGKCYRIVRQVNLLPNYTSSQRHRQSSPNEFALFVIDRTKCSGPKVA